MSSMHFSHWLVLMSQSYQSHWLLSIICLYFLVLSQLDMTIDDDDVFHFHPVSCKEVRKVVQSFPLNKAPRNDKVSMRVVKGALSCILPTLTEIVNCSLQSSVFPTCWKRHLRNLKSDRSLKKGIRKYLIVTV